MTITIDDALVGAARKALGTASKAETIRLALHEVLRRERLSRALEHQGGVELELDQAALAALRAEP